MSSALQSLRAKHGNETEAFVVVPIRIRSPLNGSQGFSRNAVFAAARERKQHRSLVALMLRSFPSALFVDGCIITLTRIAPRPLDDDNLRAGCKSVRDGVADWLGLDDRDPRIDWRYGQRRGKPKTYAVEIEITRRPT